MVHRRTRNIEREPSDNLVHQNAKVIAQIRSCHAECPHAAQHQRVAAEQEPDREALGEGREEEGMCWLGAQGALVDEVAGDSEGEDGHGQQVAAAVGVVAGEAREGLVVVFAAGGGVPEGRVEDDEGCGSWFWVLVCYSL